MGSWSKLNAMPLLPLPWQELTGEPTSQVTYSDLMSREAARPVNVSINTSPEGQPPWWRIHFGIGVNVTLNLTDETVRKLSEEIERCRLWYEEQPKR